MMTDRFAQGDTFVFKLYKKLICGKYDGAPKRKQF